MSRIRRFVVKVVLPAAFGLAVLGAGSSIPLGQGVAAPADVSTAVTTMDIYWN